MSINELLTKVIQHAYWKLCYLNHAAFKKYRYFVFLNILPLEIIGRNYVTLRWLGFMFLVDAYSYESQNVWLRFAMSAT